MLHRQEPSGWTRVTSKLITRLVEGGESFHGRAPVDPWAELEVPIGIQLCHEWVPELLDLIKVRWINREEWRLVIGD